MNIRKERQPHHSTEGDDESDSRQLPLNRRWWREGATNTQQDTQAASIRATTNLAITELKTIATTDTIRTTRGKSSSYAIWTNTPQMSAVT